MSLRLSDLVDENGGLLVSRRSSVDREQLALSHRRDTREVRRHHVSDANPSRLLTVLHSPSKRLLLDRSREATTTRVPLKESREIKMRATEVLFKKLAREEIANSLGLTTRGLAEHSRYQTASSTRKERGSTNNQAAFDMALRLQSKRLGLFFDVWATVFQCNRLRRQELQAGARDDVLSPKREREKDEEEHTRRQLF
jgi:hypothetical protein